MNDGWFMVVFGTFLVVSGCCMTAVSGAMPGATPGPPPSLRYRLIQISFGAVIAVLGVIRLIVN